MNASRPKTALSAQEIEQRVRSMGEWFHNLDLRGVRTAPHHFLGDYPAINWNRIAHALPADLTGKAVLDIGCNAGFFSMEMKRRGAARVVAIDNDERYLAQGRFAAEVNRLEIEFRNLCVYDVGLLGEKFALVLFMGVLYHLRHPLLALDLLYEHVVGDLLFFQSMQRGSQREEPLKRDYPFEEQAIFERLTFPLAYFIEHEYAHDWTNWWIFSSPAPEFYLCRRREMDPSRPRVVYPRTQESRTHG